MDTDVVVKAQGGDQQAFALLAIRCGRRMNALAVGILRDRDLAEDAVQQALLSIWKDLPSLRDPSKFESWSYKLLVRACYAEARRKRRHLPEILVGPASLVAADASVAVADRDQLERGFDRLSAEQRAVVVLHSYFDMPLEQVASVLGVPAGTARSRLHRALQSMRAALEADSRVPAASLPQQQMQEAGK